jgi:lipopolysaccharide-induced tumor necrosis factor-alpha factor
VVSRITGEPELVLSKPNMSEPVPSTAPYHPIQPSSDPPHLQPPSLHQDNPHPAQPADHSSALYVPVQPGQQVREVTNPAILLNQAWTNSPQVAYCANCRSQGVTSIKHTAGTCTWLSCVACFCMGCYLGCCLIPFCVNSLQDCEHHCSNCGDVLGRKTVIC